MIEYLLKLDDQKAPNKRLTKIKDGHFCVSYKVGRRTETYDIALERCPDHAETVKWAWHLLGKETMTKEAVADFLLVAFNYNQKAILGMIAD